MQALAESFREAHGYPGSLSALLSPYCTPDDPDRLYNFYHASNEHTVEDDIRRVLKQATYNRLQPKEINAWTDVFVSYWRAVGAILKTENPNQGSVGNKQHVEAYEAWKELLSVLMKHLSNMALPPFAAMSMYLTGNYLRILAIRADDQLAKTKGNVALNTGFQDDIVSTVPRSEKLEEAARVFNRMFALCVGDRNADMSQSRKWGTYYVANLQFKTYFKLKNISLSKNIVKSIEAQADLPPFYEFPTAHRVTYKYYVGVLAFLQEDYNKAEACLTEAWDYCHASAIKNQELILTYLIPCRLITKHTIPTQILLSSYPRLERIFGPLVACIKSGDLAGFDHALVAAEDEFVKRRIYLTLERGRDIALRNLLRNVFISEGYEDLKEGQTEADRMRKTRIPISHFSAALKMRTAGEGGGQISDEDEVECLLANMIYKGLMKGYMSREHSMVVLNKKGAFPGTGI